MALGKKIIEVNFVDLVKGQSTSQELGDAGFSPLTDGVQLLALPGILYNPPIPTDYSVGLIGEMVASCEDPSGSYARLFVSAGAVNAGRFYSMSTGYALTQRGSTDSTNQYIQGRTDMIAFDGEAYITNNATLVRWSSIGSLDTIDPSFFSFNDATVPHPAITYNNFAYYGDGNLLLRQDAANTSPVTILTLATGVIIVAIGIDPGSGNLLLSLIGQPNLSDTINSGARVAFYDGFSTQVLRYVQVEDMVTAFAPTEGSLYCAYGQNFGLWNGSGITFKKRMNVNFDNTQLMYKQHFTSIGSTVFFIEKARVIAYGPVRQNGDNIFYPALTNSIGGSDVNLTHIVNVGSNQMAMSYASSQFAVWDSIGLHANTQNFFSNNYNFDDEVWIRRARIIYESQVANGATPGDLTLYDQDGLITDINATGTYDLTNEKGFASAFIDVDNINLKLKELTFGLLLNDFTAPSITGTPVSTNSHASVNTLTLSITVPSDLQDSVLCVMIANGSGTNATGTYNGSTLSAINYTTGAFFTNLLFIANPTAGTHDIVMNWSLFSTNIGVTAFVVQNAGVPVINNTATDTSTDASVAISSTLGKSLYIDFIMSQPSTQTQATGQTQISNFTVPTANFRFSSSYKAAPYPGTNSMGVTLGSSVPFQISAFTIPPVHSLINPGIQRVIFYGDPANLTGSPN